MERMDSVYHVGDMVRIVDVKHCHQGWNSNMEAMIGKVTTVTKVIWGSDTKKYKYFIADDNGGPWSYDDSCFESAELPGFEAAEDILSLFQ